MISTDTFFERPKSWSLIKYIILDKYLSAYLPKVNQQYHSPAIIADLFAGRGKFEDGTEGSPIIIAKHARTYRHKLGYNNRVILSELIDADRIQLADNMREFIEGGIVEIIPGDAANVGQYLLKTIPQGVPLFLFLDPFGIKGLSMKLLFQVFLRAKKESTELLINFNHKAIPRLIGICHNLQSKNSAIRKQAETIREIVNDSMGGEWWLEIIKSDSIPEEEKAKMIQIKYLKPFRKSFNWLCSIPVTTGIGDEDVKYYLIFASQSQVAIELMNDDVIEAKRKVLLGEIENHNVGTLFENSDPTQFIKKHTQQDLERLPRIIAEEARLVAQYKCGTNGDPYCVVMTRPEIRARLLKRQFARFTKSEYNEAIKNLLEIGDLVAENGSVRISDEKGIKLVKR
jgi:three-Cys-motif partner protein